MPDGSKGFKYNRRSENEALLYGNHFCGGLCVDGGYVLMRKVNGVWHVVDQHGTSIYTMADAKSRLVR